ncbi:MAG TPA: hypothetical protein VIK14_14065 [Ignavibacteria bacterium]
MDIFNIFDERATDENLEKFAQQLIKLSKQIGFKVSARGWCYQLESARLINKNQFDRVESVINKCRKKGILPIDFVAEEEGRQFSGIEEPEVETPLEFLKGYIEAPLKCHSWYTPDWWDGEEYYIQMLVEKIDLKTLFEPVCKRYHIPIATSKGWSSMLQRAAYANRFKEAEDNGLKCILLYCGDHDPDGLRISEFIKKNLVDLQNIYWENGDEGYSPDNLLIHRFGLNADFIYEHNLTWIDNLITGSGKNLASPAHKNFKMPYVQEYIKEFGARKCEANAIVPMPREARFLVENTIISFLGDDALSRFDKKMEEVKNEMDKIRLKTGLKETIERAIQLIDDED